MRTSSIGAFAALLLSLLFSPLAIPPVQAIDALEETPILGPPTEVTPLIRPSPPADAPVEPIPTPPATSGPTSGAATATPAASSRPDTCEPNDAVEQACALPLDAISGPFSFVPEEDRDFFRLDLPEEASIETQVTVRATDGLDLVVSAFQGQSPVASGTYSLTLAPDLFGPVVLRVENRDPRLAAGESYRIEVRRSIVAPSDAPAAASSADPLENNWSFTTAAPIAVGVVYDLTLVCPEMRPGACPGGDHDHLLIPVKAGMSYLLATFDLDPGVDTVLELFWGSTNLPATGNDDFGPGGMLSALTWTAPADGLLGVRVAPRNGGLSMQLAEGADARYRFTVAPLASELAAKLTTTIGQQANLPTPTATATSVRPASPAGGGSSVGGGGSSGGSGAASGGAASAGAGAAGGSGTGSAQETIAEGAAVIVRETVLRREPRENSTALASLAPETPVTVRGPVRGLWVSVESPASILPGWVLWSDLQRVGADGTDTAPATSSTGASPTATTTTEPAVAGTTTAARPTTAAMSGGSAPSSAGAQVSVTALDPALAPAAPPPVARVSFALQVSIVATDAPPTSGSTFGMASPTPDMSLPVPGVRVQLVNAFGDLLAEGVTDARGAIRLSRDVRPGDALAVRVPAWGVETPVAADQATLVITIPEGQR
ncbi:MAG: hypothetical protein OHK0015_35990 [Chloroflexi bacterium OHK40]